MSVIGNIPLDLAAATGFRVTVGACGFGRAVVRGAVVGGVVCGGGLVHVHVADAAGVVGVGVVGVGFGFGLAGLLFTLGGGAGVEGRVVAVLAGVGVLVVVGVLAGAGVLGAGVGVAVQLSQPSDSDRVTEAPELPAVAASAVPPPHRASTAVASTTTTEAAVHLIESPVFMESFDRV